MAKPKHVLKRDERRHGAVHLDVRKPVPQVLRKRKGPQRRRMFETKNTALAAYLLSHDGVELSGLGTGGELEPAPVITFMIEGMPSRWHPLVKAFRTGKGDKLPSASRYLAKWEELEEMRADEQLRLLRRVDDDLYKMRAQDGEDAK